MLTPIKWYGSKGGFYKKIIEHFPAQDSFDTYIEPFGGTFCIGLQKPFDTPVEIYNDMEQNLYSLYKVLSDKELFNQLKEKCDLVLYSEDLREEFKNKLREDIPMLDRAFYFLYVNRTSFNGVGGFTANGSVRRKMSKSVSDFLSCIDRLPELHQRMSKVIVMNTDGVELIKKWDKENVFIYADPPYEQSTRSGARYKVDMDREGHVKFLETVISAKSKILISGYDNELYDKLIENGFTKHHFEVNTVNTKNKPKTKIETLWKNY